MDRITALGVDHHVGGKIHVLPSRVETLAKWPEPTNVREVRGFLGAVGITRRWVKNFAEIARPLNRLTGGVPWRWTQSEQLAFELLRIKCASKVAMNGIDWSLDTHFYTDASGFAGGLVITQFQKKDKASKPVEVPIIYDALTFSATERKYPTYKQELCAMVRFTTKFQYLLRNPDCPGIIHTDHKPLVYFLESSLHDGIYGHWAAKLRELHIKVVHIKGERNVVADSLSRTIFFKWDCEEDDIVRDVRGRLQREGHQWVWKDGKEGFEAFLKSLAEGERAEVVGQGTLHNVPVFALQSSASWGEAYERSEWFGPVYRFLGTGGLPSPVAASFLRRCLDYRVDEDSRLWVHRGELHLLCIPESKVAGALQEAHDNSGHWAKEGTLIKLRGSAYWPGQSTDVERYIAGCLQCARQAPAQRSQLLRPIVTHRPFQLMAMDFIGPMEKTQAGYEYVLHIMDYFSRYSTTYPSVTANAPDVIQALEDLFNRFTQPAAFFLDRGQHFENSVVEEYMEKRGIRLFFGPSGSSKSFGLIERGNRILEDVIRKSTSSGAKWDAVLARATHEINSRVIGHLHHSPLSVLVGCPPTPPLTTLLGDSSLAEVTIPQWLESIEEPRAHCQAVQSHLLDLAARREDVSRFNEEEKDRVAERYNRGVVLEEFSVGDLVLLHQKNTGKLEARWRGPFVVDRLGEHVSFHLRQLNGRRIKRTYHGDDLRRFQPRTGRLRLPNEPIYPTSQTLRRPLRKRPVVSRFGEKGHGRE